MIHRKRKNTISEYATLKRQMKELLHQYPFIDSLRKSVREFHCSAEKYEVLKKFIRLYMQADNMEREHIYFRGQADALSYLKKIGAFKTE